jgi:hypothetical protein
MFVIEKYYKMRLMCILKQTRKFNINFAHSFYNFDKFFYVYKIISRTNFF